MRPFTRAFGSACGRSVVVRPSREWQLREVGMRVHGAYERSERLRVSEWVMMDDREGG